MARNTIINRQDLTPSKCAEILLNGNFRFINNLKMNRDLLELVNETKDGQTPFASIVSCMDSRTAAEVIFDQGLGDIFSIRVAGNVINTDILGSLEYAAAVVKAPLIVVLGHTSCGAIKGACDKVELGNLTSLLDKIQPAVQTAHSNNQANTADIEFVNEVARLNVLSSVDTILKESSIISNLVGEGKVGIVPGMYDVATGKVTFFMDDAKIKAQVEEKAVAQAQ